MSRQGCAFPPSCANTPSKCMAHVHVTNLTIEVERNTCEMASSMTYKKRNILTTATTTPTNMSNAQAPMS